MQSETFTPYGFAGIQLDPRTGTSAMYLRLFVTVLFMGVLNTIANASEELLNTFVDGRWNGGKGTSPDSQGLEECWARTTYSDGTALTLAKRSDGIWHLRLSNSSWRLSPSHQYAMVALVDFYPELHFAAKAKNQAELEIENLESISLLRLVENGHTISLTSDGFNVKYDLEGSAKIIERVRTCFAR